jgi:hypothetical protein
MTGKSCHFDRNDGLNGREKREIFPMSNSGYICKGIRRKSQTWKSMYKQEHLILDFRNKEEAAFWQIVNDGVMGGLSSSEIVYSENNTIIFKGTVSLENNGGFASARTVSRSYQLEDYDGILLHVKGDGKKYQFRLRTKDCFDGMSYRYQLATQADAWMIIDIPFEKCVPVYRGHILENFEAIVPGEIHQIGFLIANKRAEEFRLEIEWIKTYKK